jgi:hypothetical protein
MHPFFTRMISGGNLDELSAAFKEDQYGEHKFALLAKIDEAAREVSQAIDSGALNPSEKEKYLLALDALDKAPSVVESVWVLVQGR